MSLGNVARVIAVLAAVLAAVGSASSNQNQAASPYATSQYAQQNPAASPPPPREMEAARALGIWRSTFGAVKIEADASRGGLETGAVHGVWTYQRNGEWIDGYFHGNLRGNVLQFSWQEPANPPLTGDGYLVFDPSGRQYTGRWWSERRDRVGDWNGWREAASAPRPPAASPPSPYDQPRDDSYGRPTDSPEAYDAPYAPPPPRDARPRGPAQPGTYGPQPSQPTYY